MPATPRQLAEALTEVTRTNGVSLDEARALGFWNDEHPDDNPPQAADGRVEVPAWRHALINYPHPLLKRGLVVIDTPGLNAIGAEPELTLGLLPTAHATVFILGADTGVTKSDLAIWRDHLGGQALDALRRAEQDRRAGRPAGHAARRSSAQIEQQCAATARDAGRSPRDARVPAVGARRRWPRASGDDRGALADSRLPALEAGAGRRSCCRSAAQVLEQHGASTASQQIERSGRAPPRRPPPPAGRADARAARPARQERRQGAG